MKSVVNGVKTFLLGLTLEPSIVISQIGMKIVDGNGMSVDLLMHKICKDEFGHSEDFCRNLTSEQTEFDEVQTQYNNFITVLAWIGFVPSLLFALIAGALSDDFGRKPLLLVTTGNEISLNKLTIQGEP
jgi:MFS family permease